EYHPQKKIAIQKTVQLVKIDIFFATLPGIPFDSQTIFIFIAYRKKYFNQFLLPNRIKWSLGAAYYEQSNILRKIPILSRPLP
ncbi:hypothetical protein VU12_11060, partial [Desulfobulbus sp. US4]|nr:hypothetical protein [Desulfobulbus sp. US4]